MDCMVALFLNFEISIVFFSGYTIYIHYNGAEFPFIHILSNIYLLSLLWDISSPTRDWT